MNFLENPITNQEFQLYGEDLRCLDSGKPMMTVTPYDIDIDVAISICRKNVKHILKTKFNDPSISSLFIRRIGQNSFIYDKHTKLNEIFETTDKTDIHEIFELFDRNKYLFRFFASTKSKVVCAVWSHAIMDGITNQRIARAIVGIPETVDIVPIEHPPFLIKQYCVLETIGRLAQTYLWDSQLPKDLETPVFKETVFSIQKIKDISKQNGVSFPATVSAMYLQKIFKELPKNVTKLKVFIPVYIKNPNRFNNYSVLPIIVLRNKCTPTDINNSMKENKNLIFGFYELFRTNLLTNMKSNVNWLKPDVIFSSIKNDDSVGPLQINRISIYNYSSAAKIYACGLQVGQENFYINSCIQTSICKL